MKRIYMIGIVIVLILLAGAYLFSPISPLNKVNFNGETVKLSSGYTVQNSSGNSLTISNGTNELILTSTNLKSDLEAAVSGYEEKVATICPNCKSSKIRYFGTGTQKIEEVIERNGSALVVSHYARFYQMIKPTHVHVIVDGKILITGNQEIVERIDKQGFDWVKAEYGIDVNKVDLRPSSIGLCGVKERIKNAK